MAPPNVRAGLDDDGYRWDWLQMEDMIMNSVPTGFWEWIMSLNEELLVGIYVFSSVLLVLTMGIISFTLYKMHKNRLEDSLKRELLDRGLTADEIATVVRTKPIRSRLSNPNEM